MKAIAILTACVVLISHPIMAKESAPIESLSLEERASEAHMDLDEFILISSITEAESDRSTSGSLQGRIYISLVILNRAYADDRFPDTITEVIGQRGQFSTCRRNSDGTYYSVTERTDRSDEAVIEAVRFFETGEAPMVLFFNCRGFFSGREPFPNPEGGNTIGGNYFSL